MMLTDALPPAPDANGPDPDAVYNAFADVGRRRGLSAVPAPGGGAHRGRSGANVILSTPTGSGKSLVAIGAHFAALASGRRSFYTAPIKALVSEKFFALFDIFGAEQRRHDDRRRQRQRRRPRSSAAPPRCWPTSRCATAPTPMSARS